MPMKHTSAIATHTIRCLLAAILLAWSAPAAAQSNEELAVEHFDIGARLFYEGDFSGSIVEFRKAYDYNPDPMILYNISLAHARLGNTAEALRIGRTAASSPNNNGTLPPQVALRNDARIAALSIALTSETITARTAAEASNAALAAGFNTGGFRHPDDAPPLWERLTPVGWTGVATASAGVVLLAYSAAVNYGLGTDIARYQTTPDPQEYNRLKDDITTRSARGRITLYSGAALTAIGAGLLTFDLLYDRSNADDASDLELSQSPTLKIGLVPGATQTLIQIVGTY